MKQIQRLQAGAEFELRVQTCSFCKDAYLYIMLSLSLLLLYDCCTMG